MAEPSGAGEVLMRVTRLFPWRGRTYAPGAERPFPVRTARWMEAQRPPYGVRMTDAVSASRGGRKLAREHGFDLTSYAGQGSGPDGRIYQEDVERWLDESETTEG